MKPKSNLILLIICSGDNSAELVKELTQKLGPARSIVLCHQKSEDADEIEYRQLPAESPEDCILKTIREIVDIFESELICCVAGNPELNLLVAHTMGLTARYVDRLYHVQIEPFRLVDIHFPRLCYLYQDRFNRLPETYADTVELANLRVSRHIDAPELFLKADPYICLIGECELPLDADEFILLWLLASRCKNEVIPIQGETELLDEYQAFIESTLSTIMPEISQIPEQINKNNDHEIRLLVESLTAKIKKYIAFDNGRDCALPEKDPGIYGISFPPENIICPRNY